MNIGRPNDTGYLHLMSRALAHGPSDQVIGLHVAPCHFPKSSPYQAPSEGTNEIDEKHAFQVVVFVLHHTCEKTADSDVPRLEIAVEVPHPDTIRADDSLTQVWD